jgi:hypothetical protein
MPVRLPRVPLLLFLCALIAAPHADAAPPALAERPGAAANPDAVAIAPHRAIYDMTLSSVKNGSNVSDVSGTMIFEWADACDGWTIQQNLQLHFTYAEGDQSTVASNEVTWESKDGKDYNFNIRRLNDGKETENYRGKAHLDGGKGIATYTAPEGKTVKLAGNTVFPSAHTRLIIAKAMAGEHFFTRRVFDGSDEEGSNDVSVFIAPAKTPGAGAGADAALDANPLLAATAWPVHMAFFKLDDETGEPDYEMDLLLLANGVARSMRIDYGDFSVTGNLKAIEPLPAPHC